MNKKRKRCLFLEELEAREVLSTFFVATTGSDSAAGTQAAPWLTLSHALSSVASGDTIDLRGGTYAGNVQVKTSNLTLESFTGEHAIVSSPTNNSSLGIVIWVLASGFTLNNVEVTGGYYYGLKFELGQGDNGLVENCQVHDTGDHCIKVQTNNMTFLHDEVYHSGLNTGTAGSRGIDAVIPSTGSGNLHITQCYFHDIASYAFYGKGGVKNCLFERNLIVNCSGGLILGGDTDTNLIDQATDPNYYENIGGVARNNIIVNTTFAGIGLWAADNAQVYNNTLINVAQVDQGGIFLRDVAHTTVDTPCTNVTVINNIVSVSAAAGRPLFDIHDIGTAALTGTLLLANNLYYAGTGTPTWRDDRNGENATTLSTWQSYLSSIGVTTNDLNSRVADPQFNSSTDHIAGTSPAVDAGQTLVSFSNDYYGTSRPQGLAWDIGAEEVIQSAPGVATHFSITAPASTTAGSPFSITVTALDAFNNTAATYTGTIHFTSSDGAAVLPTDYIFTAADAGVHTFTNGVTLITAGSKSVTATDVLTGTITGSASLTVNAAAASTLVVSGYPSPTTAGVSHSFTVTAEDAFGNTATGYTGTVTFSSTDSKSVLPANYTFLSGDVGMHSFSATLKTAGSQSITATDTVTSTVKGSQSGVTVNPAATSKLAISAYPSSTTAGVAHSFTVTAQDSFGNTTPGYTGIVTFSSSDSQAVLPANYTFVGADSGVHSFSATLKTAGSQSITTTDTVTTTIMGNLSGITVNPAATSALLVSGYSSPTTAGVSHGFTVTAKDAFGNTTNGYIGTVALTSSDGQAVLPANYTFTSGDAGVHSFSGTLKTAGSQSITATDTVTTTIQGSQSSITVNPAAAGTLIISGYASPTTAGISHSFTVTAKDAFGNTATGYTGTATFTSTDGQAALPANYTFVSGDGGVHSFSATLKTAGSQSVTATDTGASSIKGTQSGITVNPAAAGILVVSGYPSPTTAGVSHSFTVTAKDAFGNTATGYTGTAAFTSSDAIAVLPANYTFLGSDSGVHSFSGTLKTAGSQSITATDTVTTTIKGSQSGITVNPAATNALVVSGYPSPTTAGVSHSFTVTAKDAFGNTATGYTGTVAFTSSDAQAVLPSNYIFGVADAGAHSFSATLKTTGSQSITATDTVTTTINGSQSGILVTTGASMLVVGGYLSPTTAGVSNSFTIAAQDGFGNTVTNYTGTVTFSSSDAQAVLPANYTFTLADSGVHAFNAILKTAGGQSITATDTVTNTIKGSQSGITVNPAAASTFVVSGYASPTTAGTSHSFTVTAKDAFGNTATGYTGTATLTSSDGQAVLPANYTFTSGDAGVHSFSGTLKTAGTQSITATDTVASTIKGSQAGINVNPAAASIFVVSGFASPTSAGVAHNFTVTAKDSFGNIATGYLGTTAFTSSDSKAVLPANYTFTGTDAGVHSLSATLKTSGSQSITATDNVTITIQGSQSSITVNPAAAVRLVVTGFPSSTAAGVSQSLKVTAQDTFGNTATSYSGTISFGSTDPKGTLPANYTFTGADAGIHSFSATLKSAGLQSITATDSLTSTITGTESGISVSPAAMAGLQVAAPGSVTSGKPFTITVSAVDPFSNVVSTYTGTIHFTSSDAGATLPLNYTFVSGDAGVHSFTNGVTLLVLGSQTVTTSDTVNTTLTGQAAITVNSGILTPALFGRASSSGQVWGAVSNGSSAFTNTLWAAMSTAVTWADVLMGDFNGDGMTDIVARVAQSGDVWVGLSTGSTFQFSRWTTWSTAVSWVDVRVGDFNGDGKADLAGRVLQTGQWWVAQSTGSSFSNSLWTTWSTGISWAGVSVGDFNGDGKDDIAGLGSNGQWWIAQSNGTTFTNALWASWSTGVTWVDIQAGDFNGDGKTDLTARALQLGEWWTSLSTGSLFTTTKWASWSTAVAWVDVKVGDFNGDGKTDIIGRAASSGQWWLGQSTGSGFNSILWTTWSTAVTWVDVQAGDFNRDGKTDLTGRALESGQWWMSMSPGTTVTSSLWATWSTAVNWVDVRLARNL